MQIGVTLPSFRSKAGEVLEAARAAEEAGLHGVFHFDHLWPLGHPERPSLAMYPMLGAVGAMTSRVRIGSLVARVGLLPDEVVEASLVSLHQMLGDRLIAGLGTGDEASAEEHERNGIPYLGTDVRHESLCTLLGRLTGQQIECWVGGGSEQTNETARDMGVALNLWGASAKRIELVHYSGLEVTWGGPLSDNAETAAAKLRTLMAAGASWAVWAWPDSLRTVVEAARMADLALTET
jgi:alkanesulfonate monooxygenase SsuD/methylene tetrahydromethanopterin reductase-like flavin-dependent oxidoreductase (luciferase family)